MQKIQTKQIVSYIEKNIPVFHEKRLENLSGLKLDRVLARKNPYLFKAKNIGTAEQLVRQLLDAHLSSQEETIFGDFLEGLAIHVCGIVYAGRKSTTEGIDLEFDRDGKRYIVSIKSGPNWGNASQIKKMRDYFRQARRIHRAHGELIAINGCCYGRDTQPDKGDYLKYCGQMFWELISGDETMYLELIEPLGHKAKERNEDFLQAYDRVVNKFTRDLLGRFCLESGAINWNTLVAFNSSANKPERTER
ncbi:MAG: cytosolic protein [Gammaproteobacteria bacterium]|nr:cytosolic protein [Gammaproteobacteria bacterium]